ncbi:hypothetical protein HYALB_00011044 [Hymenoscyphus albidus]|uniref:Fungal-type protein kinase domain-containing protein n=1 Tax=Hymenoscyphus albidus TaxID=595503 RepID=A0A9N9QB52_9HELO|nr:hypothetical protein HYALB_00011044 [Hymenoscyphus albidus]
MDAAMTPSPSSHYNNQASLPSQSLRLSSLLEEAILEDINGYIFGAVEGFYDKYFVEKPWSNRTKIILQVLDLKFRDGRWTECYKLKTYSGFYKWLLRFQAIFLTGQDTQYKYSKAPSHHFGGSIVLSLPNESSWASVQVIGEFRSGTYKAGFLRLCGQAREVFASQPIRRFLHGFYVIGDMMELWVFDRSGLYSCDPFAISQHPDQLVNVMAGYFLMSHKERGGSTLMQEDINGNYIKYQLDASTSIANLYLDRQPIASTSTKDKNFISDGLVCYRARHSNSNKLDLVVKLKWRPTWGSFEKRILDLIKEKKVCGVSEPVFHGEFDSTKDLRGGLVFGSRLMFSNYDSRGSSATGILNYTEEVQSTSSQGTELEFAVPFKNSLFCCTVVSPIGRSLHTFETVSELLEAFRDAIKCHRSLYQDGKILHQEISDGNILICDSSSSSDPRGVLIDMEVVRELRKIAKKGEIIGAGRFMSIGELTGSTHTYRHDLESFLYVLLYVIICGGSEELPETSRLCDWTEGDQFQLGQMKQVDMQPEEFESIISEFPENLKNLSDLAKHLRRILFQGTTGGLWTGTDTSDEGTNALYENTIHAFESAINSTVNS